MKQFERTNFSIEEHDSETSYAKFVIEPLERGFGTTLGNALRRVLLSSLPGASTYAINVEGAHHEFSVIDGVVEDVTSIILNLKDLVLSIDNDDEVVLTIDKKGEGPIYASDILIPAGVEVINKDLVIANLAANGHLQMDIYARNGRGYVQADINKKELKQIGMIPTDSNYSPVERVSYSVEPTRVGENEKYDRLIMEIITNGSKTCQEVLALAAKILMEHLNLFVELNDLALDTKVMADEEEDNSFKVLDMPIEDLDLSVRSYNCLKRANIQTVQELISRTEDDMNKIRNLGKKSLKEIKEKVIELGLSYREEEN
ncbi:DNA-directed RNA polymerase subunit alpha [Bacilli bacterium PM5-3]|nr:DNA-directed RNA polymerase subunit alpha [Bacilli bacterium PM5-3]MDH6604211.1 DNA-directed RNA polymerase subunit alpha [Bacilli bacterium PM5-9]